MKKDIDTLPFPNIGNSPFYTREFHVGAMLPMMGSTQGWGTKLAETDIEDVVDDTEKKIEKRKDVLKPLENTGSLAELMYENFFGEASKDVPTEMKDIVDTLESKGYYVKYSSPGYNDTSFKSDRNKDQVIYSKFASTARVIFSNDYKFPNTPSGWEWRVVNKDAKSLYVKRPTYNRDKGDAQSLFNKWKEYYMGSLREWAQKLPKQGTYPKGTEPDINFN